MKAAVLGSGDVGKTLAAGLAKHGHEVMLGSREPGKLAAWAGSNPGVRLGSYSDAARFGEIIVLAVQGSVAADVLRRVEKPSLAGKCIIDVTNPIAGPPSKAGVLPFFTTHGESLMERLQREFPGGRFVKAFNSVGYANMVNPQFKNGPPTMFICGNDESAKGIVKSILEQFGWESADMGAAEAARAIEPLCMLWCIPIFLHHDTTHAFKLLRR